jgi:hypothetical protein
MSETTPRELIPESIMTPELPAESESVGAVRQEKDTLEQGVDEAFDAIRNLGPGASKEEIADAMDAQKAAQARYDSFQEMWADYGGQAVDDAQEAVNKASTDPTSTTYARAIARLTAAEDAFHSRVQSERDAIYEDAYKENDAFNVEVDAAIAASPALTEMNDLALKISHLRNDEPNPRTVARDRIRLEEYEEKLGELQDAFLRSDEFDTRYANEIANRSLRPVEEKAGDHTPGEDKVGDDAPEAEKGEEDDHTPETDKVEDEEKDDDHTPEEDKVDEDDHTPEVDKVDDEKEDDEDHIPEEDKVEDDDEDHIPGEDKVGDDDEDGPDHIPGEDKVDEDDDKEDEPEEAEKKKWYKRLGKRLHTFFTYENEDGERKLSGKKLTYATLGLAAVAAAAYFTFRTGTDHSHMVPNGPKGGDAIDAGSVPPVGPEAIVPGADLPPSAGFDYPWIWASEAFGADHAMSSLQDLAAKAVEDGKNVEWHGSGTRQWLEIDGNSNTKQVIDILRQYHK